MTKHRAVVTYPARFPSICSLGRRSKQENGHFVTLTPLREVLKAKKRPFRDAEPGGEEREGAKEKTCLAIIGEFTIFGVGNRIE